MERFHVLAVAVAISAHIHAGTFARQGAEDGQKGQFSLKPVKGLSPSAVNSGHLGVFVGVNRFNKDNAIRPLRFAVNDAITLAHVFVLEIKLIDAKDAIVMLAGDAAGEECRKELSELITAGVQVLTDAGRNDILRQLDLARKRLVRADQLLVAAISSHGFEHLGKAYIMASDGQMGMMEDTAIPISALEKAIGDDPRFKRVLFLDACRNDPLQGARMTAGMAQAFRAALGDLSGQAILASADVGQISWEDDSLQHGAFAASVIRGLRGHAPADSTGLIRLEQLVKFVEPNLEAWCDANGKPVQRPWFKGPESARRIPLAVDTGIKRRITKCLERLGRLFTQQKITSSQLEEARRLLEVGSEGDAQRLRGRVYSLLGDKDDVPDAMLELARIALDALPTQSESKPVASTDPPAKQRVEASAAPAVAGGPREIKIDDATSIMVVEIPAGQFQMGAPNQPGMQGPDGNEGPQHKVTFVRGFAIGQYEVTQAQWEAVMGDRPAATKDGNNPVTNVTWLRCQDFCKELSDKIKRPARLPTEAEWEYACRAGATSLYYFGNKQEQLAAHAWHNQNSGGTPHNVGKLAANAWGLFDMHGNVNEWVQDGYLSTFKNAPNDGSAVTQFEYSGARVVRGGAYFFEAFDCRASRRDHLREDWDHEALGFRVVIDSGR